MMLLVAVVPIVGFFTWIEHNSFKREVTLVHESHLIIAKNLSAALSRYTNDAKSTFDLAVENFQVLDASVDYSKALTNYHICHVLLLDADGRQIARLDGNNDHPTDSPAPELLNELLKTAREAGGETVISGIRHHAGEPHFFILKMLEDGKTAVAPLDVTYVNALQKSIAFGELGHSMIVDQDGLVVAHPNAEWQRISKDASKLSVVSAMIEGGTGVMEFYSPPMQADMIAGYTYVPETGWGVMVPQPISELEARAHSVQSAAVFVGMVQLMLAMGLSWWLSSWLTRPIRAIADAAREVSAGNFKTRVGRLPSLAPGEIVQTATTFDSMVERIDGMTKRLQDALSEAEQRSDERARLLEAAEEANVVKSQFVSMVSHELRTPLTSIKGALELMQSGVAGEIPEETRSLLDIAVRNGQRLATMIDDLLDMEKLDAGKLQFDFEKTELGNLVAEAIQANEAYGTLADVTFKYDLPEQPILVQADANRMMQVMANLLSNAVKFSEAGDVVEVAVSSGDGKTRVMVQDHGAGIPEGVGDSIFEAFVQLDSSDCRSVGGSGLGLSIARMIVARHQGTLTYSSVAGEGTTFMIELPEVEA